MGQVESDLAVPPISGAYLFNRSDQRRITTMDPHVSKLFNQSHPAYTAETLKRAIGEGVNSQSKPMSPYMPRYQIAERDLDALIAYLSDLSSHWSPGASDGAIEFATIITPEVSAERRKVFKDTLLAIVRQKNANTVVASEKSRNRHNMTSAAELVLGTERRWNLHVWELVGDPDTWGAQLERFYAEQPVFALVSGISDGDWSPVQAFCELHQLPIWFPSVAAREEFGLLQCLDPLDPHPTGGRPDAVRGVLRPEFSHGYKMVDKATYQATLQSDPQAAAAQTGTSQ
jgi:hypothetical protein